MRLLSLRSWIALGEKQVCLQLMRRKEGESDTGEAEPRHYSWLPQAMNFAFLNSSQHSGRYSSLGTNCLA